MDKKLIALCSFFTVVIIVIVVYGAMSIGNDRVEGVETQRIEQERISSQEQEKIRIVREENHKQEQEKKAVTQAIEDKVRLGKQREQKRIEQIRKREKIEKEQILIEIRAKAEKVKEQKLKEIETQIIGILRGEYKNDTRGETSGYWINIKHIRSFAKRHKIDQHIDNNHLLMSYNSFDNLNFYNSVKHTYVLKVDTYSFLHNQSDNSRVYILAKPTGKIYSFTTVMGSNRTVELWEEWNIKDLAIVEYNRYTEYLRSGQIKHQINIPSPEVPDDIQVKVTPMGKVYYINKTEQKRVQRKTRVEAIDKIMRDRSYSKEKANRYYELQIKREAERQAKLRKSKITVFKENSSIYKY